MIFEIDGFDIVPYIGEEGITWQWNGVDGSSTGRTLDAQMQRELIAIKARADISCLWMPKEEAVLLHKKIMPKFVTVTTDTIPWIDGTVTRQFYSNNGSSKVLTEYSDGTKLYGDVTFPLIER